MGGSAFLIDGNFDVNRATAAAARPSFFDRLRGRKPPSVSSLSFPNGRTMLEFPTDAIHAALAHDYLAFVRGRLTQPSQASQVVLDYLQLGQPRIYLRAERAASQTEGPWYVQVTFSGAAGMAETSARVAAHWAALWYAARAGTINERILGPAGFSATGAEPLENMAFADAGEYGYAELEEGAFAFDASFRKQLEQQHGPDVADGRCRCQMCSGPAADG
jgi:hypothetical protein